MRKKVIAIDVDLTVVDTLTPWLDWFFVKTGKSVKNEDRNYDLVPEMTKLINESWSEPFNPMDFWKKDDLYDDLEPAPDSVEVITWLKDEYNIVFVSSCVTEHTDSKIRFLKKHFGEDIRFISTFHKEFVDYDILIDDRLHHMMVGVSHRPLAKHILFTGYRADGTDIQRMPYDKAGSWKHILNFFFKPGRGIYVKP